jgi:hypothetical protein
MSVHMARNWWAIGLRGVATIAFGLAVILTLPSATTASLVTLFAAYLAADGFFAILTADRAAKHARRWWMQILEGLTNLGVDIQGDGFGPSGEQESAIGDPAAILQRDRSPGRINRHDAHAKFQCDTLVRIEFFRATRL